MFEKDLVFNQQFFLLIGFFHEEIFIFFSANGDIIVTLLPVNTKWPWVTPARFRPELVPEELMAQGLTVSFSLIAKYFFLKINFPVNS